MAGRGRKPRWGEKSVIATLRIPESLITQLDNDCREFEKSRTDILLYLLAGHYGYEMESPFEQSPVESEQLDLTEASGETPAAPRKKSPRKTRAA